MAPARAPVLVAGAGAWGTALAIVAARTGPVLLWGRDAAQLQAMREVRENRRYLPDIPLPPALEPIADLRAALARCADVILVVPSQALRETCALLRALASGPLRVAFACKGFERGTLLLPAQVLREALGERCPLAVLSGPTFAREVAEDLPAAITVGTHDAEFGAALVGILRGGYFRPYLSDDPIGVQVGGALKNVIAIAAGICDGLGLGANSRAAIITRGLAEISRLGVALGGRAGTFMGLSGLGDLVLTCTDDQSRNRRLGLALGGGRPVAEALARAGAVVEGANTAQTAAELAQRHGVEMPITRQVAAILRGDHGVREAAAALLARDPGTEVEPPI